MDRRIYRYVFVPDVAFDEVKASLVLAIFGTESLHGESRTRLDAAHEVDEHARSLAIDASTTVGRTLNRLFVGFLQREFGPDSFRVERGMDRPATRVQEAAS
jgi:hypothetical protein